MASSFKQKWNLQELRQKFHFGLKRSKKMRTNIASCHIMYEYLMHHYIIRRVDSRGFWDP